MYSFSSKINVVYIPGRTVLFSVALGGLLCKKNHRRGAASARKYWMAWKYSPPLLYLHKHNLFGCDYGPVYAGNFIIFLIDHIRATQLESKQAERAISALGYGRVLGLHTDMYFNKGLYRFSISIRVRCEKSLLCCCLLSCSSFLGYCICVSIYVNITSNSS